MALPDGLWSGEFYGHEEALFFYVGLSIPLSVILGFLRQKTGSVWAAAVAHVSYNLVVATRMLVSPFVEWVYCGLIVLIAVGILARKQLLSEENFERSHTSLLPHAT